LEVTNRSITAIIIRFVGSANTRAICVLQKVVAFPYAESSNETFRDQIASIFPVLHREVVKTIVIRK
jgi:hypothetical protein